MKKILTLVLVAMTVASQAVSFTWDSNNVKVSFDNATTIAQAGGITATLLWLGTSTSATIDDYTIANGVSSASVQTKSTGLSSGKGKYSGSFDHYIGAPINNSQSTLQAGDYFTVLLTYTDSENVTWYNLSSSVYQLPTTADDTTTGLEAHFSHSFTMNDRGTALTAGGGWTAAAAPVIPEPSTATLALAGLAMLIKRRKA